MSKPRTGAPKRVAVGLLAGALAMFGVALAPPAGAAASVTTSRLAGTTRYGTAQAIATSTSFPAPTTAIVATGENFPDALAASTLAGANVQAPIVLTQTATYTAEAKATLASLKAKGVAAVTIVGGTSAVAQSVEDAIKADGFTVTRVAGDDRYETAAAIASAANTKSAPAAIGGLKTALIATGTNYPDALAGGPAAYANKLPLLLVSDTVPAETANAISTLGIKKVIILGGTAAVSATVEAQLVTATGNPATRLAGINRFGTATSVADYEKNTLAFPITSAVLATGVNFPDALAAGPLGGINKAPIVLTASLPAESSKWLDDNSTTLNNLFVSGGTAAVDDATVTAAKTAAQNVSNDSAGRAVTTRPELTGAAIVATVTTGQATPSVPAGTYIRYTFDEPISSALSNTVTGAPLFRAYSASNTQFAGSAGVMSFETSGNSVIVGFGGITTATVAATLTKATVAFGGIRDAGGAENPEGEASIGTSSTSTSTAGITTAPDLVSVSGFRQGHDTGTSAVDFTFDQAAFVATTTGFHLIDVQGRQLLCTGPGLADTTTASGQTIAGGNGTTIITTTCANQDILQAGTNGTLDTTANIARGFVDAGAVGTVIAPATGIPNPLEAARVAGSSTTPDLVSLTLTAGATSSTVDSAVFTFDESILQATAANFQLYSATGATIGGGTLGTTTGINASNTTQVLINFPAGTLTANNIVGGNITDNGVTGAAAGLLENQEDEVGVAGSSTSTSPGKTSGPDLLSAVLSSTTDAFGNSGAFQAAYTFDEAATVLSANNFFLYLSNGTRLRAGSCTAGTTTATAAVVTCTGYVDNVTGIAPTTSATVGTAVVGTVAFGAVAGASGAGSDTNPEGAIATTGGTGTPAS